MASVSPKAGENDATPPTLLVWLDENLLCTILGFVVEDEGKWQSFMKEWSEFPRIDVKGAHARIVEEVSLVLNDKLFPCAFDDATCRLCDTVTGCPPASPVARAAATKKLWLRLVNRFGPNRQVREKAREAICLLVEQKMMRYEERRLNCAVRLFKNACTMSTWAQNEYWETECKVHVDKMVKRVQKMITALLCFTSCLQILDECTDRVLVQELPSEETKRQHPPWTPDEHPFLVATRRLPFVMCPGQYDYGDGKKPEGMTGAPTLMDFVRHSIRITPKVVNKDDTVTARTITVKAETHQDAELSWHRHAYFVKTSGWLKERSRKGTEVGESVDSGVNPSRLIAVAIMLEGILCLLEKVASVQNRIGLTLATRNATDTMPAGALLWA